MYGHQQCEKFIAPRKTVTPCLYRSVQNRPFQCLLLQIIDCNLNSFHTGGGGEGKMIIA